MLASSGSASTDLRSRRSHATVSTPCSASRSRTERSLKRATPMTRRDGDARLARRASVGPILPATPRMKRSPSTVARSSTRARVGRVRKSSRASTDAKRSGRDEGSRRSTCRSRFEAPPQFSGASPRQGHRVAYLAPRQRGTAMAAEKIVRIGGASGFWGDSRVAAPQLVASGAVDYLVFDYLAETTMAILAAARLKRPELGYATDFVDVAMRSVLGEIARRGIKVVSNAGGIHPRACVAALEALMAAEGLALKVAVVEGDDVSAQVAALAAAGTRDMERGDALPARVLSANAYLGAMPIAAALAAGADIVVTGRVVDSALALGPLVHEFGWSASDHDLLAAGSLVGHIIECGCQATGGLFTDWEAVPDWANIGYPIAECRGDGTFRITKPAGTGGLIARGAVAEQLLYEIGDPGAYVLPDVVCDFRHVTIEQDGVHHVRVAGARGMAPTGTYKVSATALAGFRCAGSLVIVGIDAVKKAERTGAAIVERTSRLLREAGLADFTATHVEVIGAESSYG